MSSRNWPFEYQLNSQTTSTVLVGLIALVGHRDARKSGKHREKASLGLRSRIPGLEKTV
jgi:hypothetical protein